jgi:plasmid maintenance system antidote protein VapI
MRHRNPQMAARMASAHLTVKELAEAAGIHPVTMSRVFNGRQRLSAATAARVASVLGTTAKSLGLTKAEGGAE